MSKILAVGLNHTTAPVDLRERLAGSGFYSLVDDALDKVRQGVSTLDEMLRVLPYRYLKSAVDRAEAASSSAPPDR